MTFDEMMTQYIRENINHEILIELFKAAGMGEKEIKEYSKNFFLEQDAIRNRQLGIVKNEDIHDINNPDN